VLLLASISAQLADFATNTIDQLGLAGVFVLMLLESACVPIPSEATMLFAGFNVADGHWSLLQITVAGVLGNLVGSWIAYGVGYLGRVELLERHGRLLHVSPRRLRRADAWFERWGAWAVLFSRMLPIVRTFISLPAGVARMPLGRFSALTVAGCLPWVLLLGFIGEQARESWTKWKDGLHYLDYAVVAAIVLVAAWYGLRWWRGRRAAEPAAEPAADVGP
jgi:membrane protein DedA with SNARE-associated domain